MSESQLWNDVDDHFTTLLAPADEILTAALRDSEAAGLPPINVAPNQGKLLQLLAEIQGARRILEIGTLGGYSTIWLGRALPAGRAADHPRVRPAARRGRARQPRPGRPGGSSRCGWAAPWSPCRSWRTRTPSRSTWSSSTRTR